MARKILIVIDDFFPEYAAPSVRINSFIKHLNDEVYVLGGSTRKKNKFISVKRPNEKHFFKFVFFLLKMNFLAVFHSIRLRPDITIVTIPKYELLFSSLFLKIFSKKLIIDIRDSYKFINYEAYFKHFLPDYFAKFFGKIVKSFIGLFLWVSLFLSSRIIVANKGIYDSISFRGKAFIVSNGVDTDLFRPTKTNKIEEKISLVYMGNFAEKDYFGFLFNLPDSAKSKLVVHLIGDGRNRERTIEEFNRFNINYIFHGFRDHKSIPELLSSMNAGFIFREKSVKESIPVVIYEFCSMSIPVITNNVGIMSEIVKKSAIGEVIENETDFSNLISEMFYNKKYFSKFSKLHRIAVDNFSRETESMKFKKCLDF